MLGIDESRDTARLLGSRDHMQRERGFAGGLWTKNLRDPPTGNTPDAEGGIKRDRPGGDDRYIKRGGLSP
jgi:hypothetical protein